jgi:hypothetical protein
MPAGDDGDQHPCLFCAPSTRSGESCRIFVLPVQNAQHRASADSPVRALGMPVSLVRNRAGETRSAPFTDPDDSAHRPPSRCLPSSPPPHRGRRPLAGPVQPSFGRSAGARSLNPHVKSGLLRRTACSTWTNVSGSCPERTQCTRMRPVFVPRPVPRHPCQFRAFGHAT